jgi:glycosyltransferase involved in cell wall biosynthesis
MGQASPAESPVDVSVVIPAYNEEESIAACLDEVAGVMRGTGLSFEVVVVDDGSRDRTLAILKERKASLPELAVIALAGNHGQTAAWEAGFRHARGEVFVTMDADLQNDPADIPRLLELIDRWDVVCGYRRKRRDSIVRRISSRVANWVRNKVTGERIRDVGCSLRAIRAPCARRLKLFNGMHRFLPTLLRYDGATVTEVPVNHRPRRWGATKYGIGNRLWRAIRDLLAVRWMRSRWIRYEIRERIR